MTAVLLPPEGALWQAVQARRPDLWPVDNEVAAAGLATALNGLADSLHGVRTDTTKAAAMTTAAWDDTAGGLMTTGLGRHAERMDEASAQLRQRAAGAQTYAGELTGAKTDIITTIEANESLFAAVGAVPFVGPPAQEAFAATVADHLAGLVDERIATVGAIALPVPPSHEELLDKYNQKPDPNGLREYLGRQVTAGELEAIEKLGFWDQVRYVETSLDASVQGSVVFPGEGRVGDQDNHRDAFRHAFWNALLTSRFGESTAETITTRHEQLPDNLADPKAAVREAMDLHNNEVGRTIARENPNASHFELHKLVRDAVQDGKMVVMDDNARLVPSNQVDFNGEISGRTTGYY